MNLPVNGAQSQNKRMQLSDEAASYVRGLIMSGQLRPGQHLRQEQVAAALEISVTPVREGLLSLRAEGFLQLQPRRGFVVAPLAPADIRDLFIAQALIAGELAARAATTLTEEQIAELQALQGGIDEAASNGNTDEMERLNHLFHRMVNTSGGSGKLLWFLGFIAKYVPRRFYATIGGWPDASLHDHSAIVRALASHDPEAARRAVTDHLRHAGDLLADHFASSNLDAAAASAPDGAVPRS
ncbi:GntR family transcriptional regulator [Micromonospora rubida]|uniref:GntR family transcriptional regulator n=1 Tax=Micromonospora rubida TaxID=2697657 RepID=A0ABW7SL04_9ACTN